MIVGTLFLLWNTHTQNEFSSVWNVRNVYIQTKNNGYVFFSMYNTRTHNHHTNEPTEEEKKKHQTDFWATFGKHTHTHKVPNTTVSQKKKKNFPSEFQYGETLMMMIMDPLKIKQAQTHNGTNHYSIQDNKKRQKYCYQIQKRMMWSKQQQQQQRATIFSNKKMDRSIPFDLFHDGGGGWMDGWMDCWWWWLLWWRYEWWWWSFFFFLVLCRRI